MQNPVLEGESSVRALRPAQPIKADDDDERQSDDRRELLEMDVRAAHRRMEIREAAEHQEDEAMLAHDNHRSAPTVMPPSRRVENVSVGALERPQSAVLLHADLKPGLALRLLA